MNSITFKGIVTTGEGKGKKYLALPWVTQQIEEKLGLTPFLGTLNLKLTKECAKQKKLLAKAKSVTIRPAEGYCVGLLINALTEGLECAVVVPQVEGYPENLLEIIASVNLRDSLKLEDGDTVTVSVNV